MKKRVILAVLLIFCLISTAAIAVQNRGSKEIKIDSGKKGAVCFSHHLHQDIIQDCNLCHSIFPKEKGAIKDAIARKKLKKKQVMNKTCLKCHREMKKAGEDHGPTSCSACHVK